MKFISTKYLIKNLIVGLLLLIAIIVVIFMPILVSLFLSKEVLLLLKEEWRIWIGYYGSIVTSVIALYGIWWQVTRKEKQEKKEKKKK